MDCLFCKFVQGELPCHKIWEDHDHMAFLTIFPNTEGFSVVIPKCHYGSYGFDQEDTVLSALVLAAKEVSKLLDKSFDDVGRTAMMMEGFGVDHLHVKLFPMHGTALMKEWKPINSQSTKYFEKYEGYISSHDAHRADETQLSMLAEKIRRNNQ